MFRILEPESSGITFANQLEESDSLNIIQYLYYFNGSGLGAGDLNNDGFIDLVFSSNQSDTHVYLNNGADGERMFREVSGDIGIVQDQHWNTGVTIVDVNADGWLDIYMCQLGGYKNFKGKNLLYINQGLENGIPKFKEEGKKYGLDFEGLATHSAFFDYDLDGDLDVYLLNHSVHASEHYANSSIRVEVNELSGDRLMRNDKDRFTDVTSESGIYSSKIGYGLGIDVGDLNGDGWPDIYVGNDFHEQDYIYLNNTNGTFREVVEISMGHTSQFSMGVNIHDINNDGMQDVLVLDMMPEDEEVRKRSVDIDSYDIYKFKKNFGYHYQLARNTLQLNRGTQQNRGVFFSDIAPFAGIDATDWSWSPVIGDYNLDGRSDLFISNGIVRRPNDLDYLNYISDPLIQNRASDLDMISHMPEGKAINGLFENQEGLRFINRSEEWVDPLPSISTAAITVDLDNDGDLDIVTSNINSPASIYLNDINDDGSKCVISLKGTGDNPSGIGTKLRAVIGNTTIYYEHYINQGFMSSAIGDIVLGLGAQNEIDSLIVTWPGGREKTLVGIQGGETIEVHQKNAHERISSSRVIGQEYSWLNGIDTLPFVHIEDELSDITAQPLMPWTLTQEGPAIASADVNGDGLIDIYVGGATGQPGRILLATEVGKYEPQLDSVWEESSFYEDTDAVFFDADGDGDSDLYVCSGGNGRNKDSPALLDRLYYNDGFGSFERSFSSLSIIAENSSSVDAGDFDNDGDIDIAVGYSVYIGKYGVSPGAQIFQNNGNRQFVPVTANFAPDLFNLGMVNDLQWADMDGDELLDLVLVGEWMPIYIFESSNGKFIKRTIPNSEGLWNTIKIEDLDLDGQLDIIAGNDGLNSVLAKGGSAGLVVSDFDRNQVIDPIVYYMEKGKKQVLFGRDILISQMSDFRGAHRDYRVFAKADFDGMFNTAEFPFLAKINVKEFETLVYMNEGEFNFKRTPLPDEAQLGPVYSIEVIDLDKDGHLDLMLFGNNYNKTPSIGRADGLYNVFLRGNETGSYEILEGPFIHGEVRSSLLIPTESGYELILGLNDNKPLRLLID
ncbi:MAG: hypothetical protein ACI9FN_003520 [Saprospiraceae bacterium]|jgi:hypothetical protein